MARAATSATEITGLRVRRSSGEPDALNQLVPLVYEECRQIAARQLRGERTNHTLTPTALVHELYIRLVDQNHATWQNRAQFYGIAAQMMRRILVDFARARRAEKRGGSAVFVSLANVSDEADDTKIGDVLAIDEALERLAARDADQVRIIELRFFAGLTVEETAHVLG